MSKRFPYCVQYFGPDLCLLVEATVEKNQQMPGRDCMRCPHSQKP